MPNGEQTVATRLRTMRERRGWSQNQLAERSTVSNSTISRIEAGIIVSPGVDILRRLSATLRVDLSDLTGERPMPKRQIQVVAGGAAVPVWKRRVHAGQEGFWDDTDDTIWVSSNVINHRPNLRAAVVDGSCMEPYIQPGDHIVFDPDQSPIHRDLVVVTTEDGQTLVKWFRLEPGGQPYLRDARNDVIRPNGAKVEGVVLNRIGDATRDPLP